jgi:dihydroorotate dehydrogenase
VNYRKPWLALPAGLAHDLAPLAINGYAYLFGHDLSPCWLPFDFKNLYFCNRLGIAGGVDKNAETIKSFERIGCGFVEIGTVTPRPQKANPGKIIDRDIKSKSLWNKMGFPSIGVEDVYYNLKNFKEHSQLPVFANVGKNRSTPNEFAANDYIEVIDRLALVSDAFVINISSPNTKGLRDLLKPPNLSQFLKPLADFRSSKSLDKCFLLKLSPDLEKQELIEAVKVSVDNGFDGFILTNTTLSRQPGMNFSNEGGVSGAPLSPLSLRALDVVTSTCRAFSDKKLIVSVGGVMTEADVFERINNGADLVQIYTALVFEGPSFFNKVAEFAKRR